MDRVRAAIRTRHLSRRTEEAYAGWVRRFILFHGKRHPEQMGELEVTQFLSTLATKFRVSASTQNQALAALLFLYKSVLGQELAWMDQIVHAKRPVRLPVVLSRDEVFALLARLEGTPRLVAALLYGSGLRVLEGLTLRIKDLDLSKREILVRDGKGRKDRRTVLPITLTETLRAHLTQVRALHSHDLAVGAGAVALPDALDRKYPAASREWAWQWLFPATRFYAHAPTGERRRHHLHETVIQRAVNVTAQAG